MEWITDMRTVLISSLQWHRPNQVYSQCHKVSAIYWNTTQYYSEHHFSSIPMENIRLSYIRNYTVYKNGDTVCFEVCFISPGIFRKCMSIQTNSRIPWCDHWTKLKAKLTVGGWKVERGTFLKIWWISVCLWVIYLSSRAKTIWKVGLRFLSHNAFKLIYVIEGFQKLSRSNTRPGSLASGREGRARGGGWTGKEGEGGLE